MFCVILLFHTPGGHQTSIETARTAQFFSLSKAKSPNPKLWKEISISNLFDGLLKGELQKNIALKPIAMRRMWDFSFIVSMSHLCRLLHCPISFGWCHPKGKPSVESNQRLSPQNCLSSGKHQPKIHSSKKTATLLFLKYFRSKMLKTQSLLLQLCALKGW